MPTLVQGGGTATIEGLTDFIKDLKAVEGDFDEEIIKVGKRVGQRVVVRARGGASSKQERAAARSLRVSSSSRGVTVSGGGQRYPYFWGAEFGGRAMTRGEKLHGGTRGPRKRRGGFRPWVGNQFVDTGWNDGKGYFLMPAVDAEAKKALREYMETIDQLMDRAFND